MANKKDKLIRIKFLDSYENLIQADVDKEIEQAILQGCTSFEHLEKHGDDYPETFVPLEITAVVGGQKTKFEMESAIIFDKGTKEFSISHSIEEGLAESLSPGLDSWLETFSLEISLEINEWMGKELNKLVPQYA